MRRIALAILGVLLLAVAATFGGLTRFATASPEAVAMLPYVSDVALDPRSPDVLYAAARNGVFRSTDGGRSWRRSLSLRPLGMIISVAVAPRRPSTVYALSWENMRPNEVRLRGIWRSRDGGRHFAYMGRVGAGWAPRELVVSTESPDVIYASTQPLMTDVDLEYVSLYRSLDGGRHWTAAARGLGEGIIRSLAVHPSAPGTLYAANARGLFRSTDRGETWTLSKDSVEEVAIDPVAPKTLYAAAWVRASYAAVFKSTNGGASWQRLGLRLSKHEVATEIVVDPKDHRVVYAATTRPSWGGPLPGPNGVYRSTDGGRAWTRILSGRVLGTTPVDRQMNEITSLVVDPKRPRVLVSTYAGVWRSLDAGRTWHRANTGLGQWLTG